jgi:predicted GNAT family N-acyltransferase
LTKTHESIRIELAQSMTHVKGGFRTRFAVYGPILHYLPDAMMADPPGLDIDHFDSSSLHFVAVREKTEEVVGTMRLVLNYPARGSGALSGSGIQPPFSLIAHSDWSLATAKNAGGIFRSKTRWTPPEFGPFPILMSTKFKKNLSQAIDETISGCELSRLVVLPGYRGYGISMMMVKMAIAKAYELQRRTILLECIPRHVEMYRKYGFRQIDDALHSRPADLDQEAIAMRLTLKDVSTRADMYRREILGKLPATRPFPFLRFGPFDVAADAVLSEPTQ